MPRAAKAIELRSRWRALARDERIALIAITLLTAAAIGVRVWFMASYRPAFLGFNDSFQYLLSGARDIFSPPQWPAGYPFFLRLVHHLSDKLSFTILVQHAMGVATGLLLYKAIRRLCVPAWLGLLPAAIVFFGGTGLFLEHSVLADPVLNFTQALALYFAVRALEGRHLRWAVLAGLAIGVGFWVRTAGISTAFVVAPVLFFGIGGERRRRISFAAASLLAVVATVFFYFAAHAYFTGGWNYERQGAWNLYARVATFVDCRSFTPPKGTAFLCPHEPLGARLPPAYYQYSESSPAVQRFGLPEQAPGAANAVIQRFAISAIVHEPLAYAGAILKSLSFFVFPRAGEGYTPESLRSALLLEEEERNVEPAVALMYPGSIGYYRPRGALAALSSYERHTRIGGALMVLLILASAAGPFALRGRARSAAILFGLTALASAALAAAGAEYDARYAYVTFGPLGASAALGAWALASSARARALAQRVRRSPRMLKRNDEKKI